MDCEKTGLLLLRLRKENGMTQKQLADKMNLSDKTISKWERGKGCPDVSLLNDLSEIFGVNIEEILKGNLSENDIDGGNMKNSKYYVCPNCGSITLSTGNASVSCCGRKLSLLNAKKAEKEEQLNVEIIEDDWYISASHPMTKEHYISFVAYATGGRIEILKQYPEWDLQTRIPKRGHGMLLWFDTQKGLMYQLI
ncbi:helix-turn-helix domain-containing protein [Lachnospiraceae bacterium NSJ-143]|nr:helix-turn-helix domain-containing protein [Lachnospiraceae bacterium NSJ-143]